MLITPTCPFTLFWRRISLLLGSRKDACGSKAEFASYFYASENKEKPSVLKVLYGIHTEYFDN